MLKELLDYIHSLFPVLFPSQSLSDLLIPVWLIDNVNTENNAIFFQSYEKIWVVVAQVAEIEYHFIGNDQNVLRALGDIVLSDPPTGDSFDLVARNNNLVKELLQADQRPVQSIQDSTRGEIKKKSCRSHPRNIMLSGLLVQWNPAL